MQTSLICEIKAEMISEVWGSQFNTNIKTTGVRAKSYQNGKSEADQWMSRCFFLEDGTSGRAFPDHFPYLIFNQEKTCDPGSVRGLKETSKEPTAPDALNTF